MTIKYFIATKAFLKRDGKILLLRESNHYQDGVNVGKYDVPGGRLDPNEELPAGLKREIFEETGLGFLSAEAFFENNVIVQKHGEEWHIKRIYFACDADQGDVILSQDHDQCVWIDPKDYETIPIIGNLADVFEAYLNKKL